MSTTTRSTRHLWPLACVTLVLGSAAWLVAMQSSSDSADGGAPASQRVESPEDGATRRAEIAGAGIPALPFA